MGFFVEECQGCRKRWVELATDVMMIRCFRRSEEGKAAPSLACQTFIAEHIAQCPAYVARRAARQAAKRAAEEQGTTQPPNKSTKAVPEPASAVLAKKERDAVEKQQTSKAT